MCVRDLCWVCCSTFTAFLASSYLDASKPQDTTVEKYSRHCQVCFGASDKWVCAGHRPYCLTHRALLFHFDRKCKRSVDSGNEQLNLNICFISNLTQALSLQGTFLNVLCSGRMKWLDSWPVQETPELDSSLQITEQSLLMEGTGIRRVVRTCTALPCS